MIKPLGNYVKIEEISNENKSKIILINQKKETIRKGIVIDIGPGQLDINGCYLPMPVKKGDIVLYSIHNIWQIQDEDKTIVMVRANSIIGIIENNNDTIIKKLYNMLSNSNITSIWDEKIKNILYHIENTPLTMFSIAEINDIFQYIEGILNSDIPEEAKNCYKTELEKYLKKI